MNKKIKLSIILGTTIPLFFILLFISIPIIYVSDYYHADEEAIEAFIKDYDIERKELDKHLTAFIPDTYEHGFIFYPGGKVESTAYEPLMYDLASKGILCVLVKMPFNLAILDVNRADDVFGYFPNVESWHIGGHSLGGTVASMYLEEHSDKFVGLVLLASYSTTNITDENIHVLTIKASEDHILSIDKYEENVPNLTPNLEEYTVPGGCHAYFGMYGKQKGDGTPTISPKEQIIFTSGLISGFIYHGLIRPHN